MTEELDPRRTAEIKKRQSRCDELDSHIELCDLLEKADNQGLLAPIIVRFRGIDRSEHMSYRNLDPANATGKAKIDGRLQMLDEITDLLGGWKERRDRLGEEKLEAMLEIEQLKQPPPKRTKLVGSPDA